MTRATAVRSPRARMFRVPPRVVFGVVIVLHLALVFQSVFLQRLWEDEAFNLTVPLNLLAGLGYVSDGTLSGSQLTPFDVRISTGPTVLLPVTAIIGLGFDPVIGARLITALFWFGLVAGLAMLGRRVSGSWGAIVAAALPLTLHTNVGHSPIQGPADLLGEPAAAALIVWAIFWVRQKPLLAALLAGFAIQAKFIALLALPALAIGLLISRRIPPRRWVAALWRPAAMAALPTVLYELVALVVLGPAEFVTHAKQFVYFLLSSGQTVEPTSVAERMQYLVSSWFLPAPLAWILLVGAVSLLLVGLWSAAKVWDVAQRASLTTTAIITLIGLTIYLFWWLTAAHTPLWIRHPSPALLAFVPVLAAFAVRGVQHLCSVEPAETPERPRYSARDPQSWIRRGVAAGAAVVFGFVMLAQSGLHLQDAYTPRTETLAMQRAHAAELAAYAPEASHGEPTRDGTWWLAADPWGGAVSIIVLTGAHVGLADAPNMSETMRVAPGECTTGAPIHTAGEYRLCTP